MFGWFRPICPCDPAAKRWVEDRLQWLVKQFGLHILLERPIILPTETFFPDPWDGSPKAVRRMFRRVCEYMGVDPNSVQLQLFDDKTPTSLLRLDPTLGMVAGTWANEGANLDDAEADDDNEDGPKPVWKPGLPWQRGVVRLERGGLDRPFDLIGIMAHELSHQRLLGEGRFRADAFDNELLTDLTAVFHGFGFFLANNPRKSTGTLGRWPGTKLYRPEYLSEPMLGYALAHIAWFRDEERPQWVRHLRWTPRAVYKQGFRYLQKTGNSTFKPVRLVQAEQE
jgi:hypothetical protein